ncbi:MAG: exodeoxyribonuclease VII large subunit [Sphaerochaetaceae bacterium]|nr:exodeoxyribonuclease VII large subunit [Sphaerochaetaceae bacterium]
MDGLFDYGYTEKKPELKFTVSELTKVLKDTIESSFYSLTVEGEISGFKTAPNGHWYFSLKDEGALINCAIWRSTVPRIGFRPQDGMKVTVTGNISLYEPRGSYSLICSSMKKAGDGDLLLAIEMRKKKYEALGYFDPKIKKPIPGRPKKVAVITSPTGAALQDILQITGRRNPGMDIIILPAIVQGPDAAPTIAARIDQVNRFALADVIIAGRGGGSFEDLLPFSEEIVIEAIHRSEIPVISAVGHEIDWALSDFVADLRAPTPSAAGELVCEASSDQREKVRTIRRSMEENIAGRLRQLRLRLDSVSGRNAGALLSNRLISFRMHLEGNITEMTGAMTDRIRGARNSLELIQRTMKALSPEAVLERGFSIVKGPDGKALTDCGKTKAGDSVEIILKKGRIAATVSKTIEDQI